MITLVDDVTELLILWPHLAHALERDSGAPAADRVTGGQPASFSLPVNADVLQAIATLSSEVPSLAYWAAGVVGEPARARPVDGHLRHMPRWHERMLVTAAADDAARLAAAVHSLIWQTKLALGLRKPDRGLSQYCPLHDDDLQRLVAPGDVAHLRYKRLDGGGRPVDVVVEWARQECASCRLCGAVWSPAQYMLLGRLLKEADARRLAAAGQLEQASGGAA